MNITFKQQGDGCKSWIVDDELTYESPTNKIHNQIFKDILKEYNYLNIAELLLWLNDTQYGNEALSIINWWKSTCLLVEEYVSSNPNEETAVEFLNNLPKLN